MTELSPEEAEEIKARFLKAAQEGSLRSIVLSGPSEDWAKTAIGRERRGMWFWLCYVALSLIVETVVYVAARRWFVAVQGGWWLGAVGVAYHYGRYRLLKRGMP